MISKLLLPLPAVFTLASCVAASPPVERGATVSAKPVFKREIISKDYTYTTLILPGDRTVVWPGAAPKPESFNGKHVYQFDLLEERMAMSVGDDDHIYWSPEIAIVRDGDKVLFDASVCEKHHLKMERKVVPISYGYPGYSREEWKLLEECGPNDGVVLGGCCVDSSRTQTFTWVCPTCKTNREKADAEILARHKAGR